MHHSQSSSSIKKHGKQAKSSSQISNPAGEAAKVGQLLDAGFTANEIANIRQQIPDLNLVIFDYLGGQSIDQVSNAAVKLCQERNLPVVFKFSGTAICAFVGDTKEKLVDFYLTPLLAKSNFPPSKAPNKEFKADMETAYTKLPQFFKDFVSRYEGSELPRELAIEIAKDANLVASWLKTAEAIKKWYTENRDEARVNAIPGLSNEHSGFSLSIVKDLAFAFSENMEAKQGYT